MDGIMQLDMQRRASSASESFLPNYRLGKTLGMGSFGKVKVAEHILTGHKVAIKILNRKKIRSMDMDEKVLREIKILRLFMHPHIIRLYEVIETHTDIFVVMEYVQSGELFDYIVEKGRLVEDEARRFFQQIVAGVEYCHRNMVVHRDLKPENLLLDADNNVKIADFGLSNVMHDGHFLKTSCGSPNYAAPEVISGRLYAGPEVDVWSCGVILYALLCGSLPFDDENIPNLFKKIKGGIYTLPNHLSLGARNLIPRMLLVDPMKRMTIPEIRSHPWFQQNLPRYLAIPPPDTSAQAKQINQGVLERVIKLGFSREHVVESLRCRIHNKGTVAYYLMLDNTHHTSFSYLGEEASLHPSPSGSHDAGGMDNLPANISGSSPLHAAMPGMSAGGRRPSQQRLQAQRKWSLGITMPTQRSAMDIMTDVYRVLQRLDIGWKKIGSYALRCRAEVPKSLSRMGAGGRGGGTVVPCSVGAGGGSVRRGVTPGLDEDMISTGAHSVAGGDAGGDGARVLEDDCWIIKFELQLFKVRDEKYVLDLQRCSGSQLLFTDLAGTFMAEFSGS